MAGGRLAAAGVACLVSTTLWPSPGHLPAAAAGGASETPRAEDTLRGSDLTAWLMGRDRGRATVLAETMTVELVTGDQARASTARHAVLDAGGRVIGSTPSGVVLAEVPVNRLVAVAAEVPGTVREPLRLDVRPERADLVQFGPTEGVEVAITGAAAWHSAGLRGAGVRIGVVDFFDVPAYWNESEMGPAPIANVTARCVDLGTDCTAEFFDGVDQGGDEHGPAVVEVIRDMAPDAEIFIGRAATEADYHILVEWFAANGVAVISRSLGSRYDGPGDGRGGLTGVADRAVELGMTWVNSGGNNAVNRYLRQPVRLAGDAVAFGPAGDDTWLRFNGCVAPGGVRWSNDWDLPAEARTDYDAYIYEAPTGNPAAGIVVASSTARQRSGAPPLESFLGTRCPGPGATLYMRIVRVAGEPTGDVIEILDYADGIAQYTQASWSASTPVVDSTSAGVIAVGAIDPPDSGRIGFYSSQGPTNDGRTKPDVAAPSGFANSTFGGAFSGTSAAAPVVAGGAALLLGAGLAQGSRELGDLVRHTVLDRGPPGPDNSYGAGEFRLPAPPSATVTSEPSTYVPLALPTRLLDTRTTGPIGPADLIGTMRPGEIVDLPVAGHAGVPAEGVTAVAANITLVGALRAGYGQALPKLAAPVGAFSSVNIDQAGQIRPNFAVVPVGQDGAISIYTNTGGDLLVDVLGYFSLDASESGSGRFVGIDSPRRVLDTRTDGPKAPLRSGETIGVAVPAELDVEDVAALVVNVTGTETVGAGFVQAFPGGRTESIDRTSTINLTAGATMANTVIVPVTADGFGLYADLGAGGSAHVVVDVTGYMTSESAPNSSSGRFVAVRPARAFDSRNGGGILADDDTVAISAGASGVEIPPSTSGVVWNLTATETVRYGFAKVWAAGSAEPPTSALNWSTAAMTVANGSIIRPDQHGVVIARVTDESFATAGPMAHLLADVFGYFT